MQLPALRSRTALLSVFTGVPAAPNRPIAQERSCTSVILRWLPPASTGNCTISGYTVEYREEGVLLRSSGSASSREVFRVAYLRLQISSHSLRSAWLGHSGSLAQKPGVRFSKWKPLWYRPGPATRWQCVFIALSCLPSSISQIEGQVSPYYKWGS